MSVTRDFALLLVVLAFLFWGPWIWAWMVGGLL